MASIVLDGQRLGFEPLAQVSRGASTVALGVEARHAMETSHAVVQRILRGDAQVSGVHTGSGHLKDTCIPPDRLEVLLTSGVVRAAAGSASGRLP